MNDLKQNERNPYENPESIIDECVHCPNCGRRTDSPVMLPHTVMVCGECAEEYWAWKEEEIFCSETKERRHMD